MYKPNVRMLTIGSALIIAALCCAAEKTWAATSSSSNSSGKTQAYLGIGVETLPQALISQMPKAFSEGSGVLVADVATDSPADKAGLKVNDVLVTYDDQRLYSPEQFVKLIRYDKPDRRVKLGVIHDGKLEVVWRHVGRATRFRHGARTSDGRTVADGDTRPATDDCGRRRSQLGQLRLADAVTHRQGSL